jgi:hypothetical protein
MGRTYTRQEIYDLVWSQPRTTLAKQLGVSDVWIGKQCALVRVPVPPAGHWARQQHGKPTFRPPLPLRLPGHPRFISIGDSLASGGRWDSNEDLTQPMHPPSFEDDIDEQVKAALAGIGKVRSLRDLALPHKSLSRVLAAEERRRAKVTASGWTWDKPVFDGPLHQRQLRIFNSLSHAFGKIGVRADVHDHQEWIQGEGTVHQLQFRIDFGESAVNLYFAEPTDSVRVKEQKPPSTSTLRVGTGHKSPSAEEWADGEVRLEQRLEEITHALLHYAEIDLRDGAQRQYEWEIERRKERIKRLEAQRIEAERKRLAALEARRKQIREGIVTLAMDRRTAEDIRSMVDALRQHPDELRESSEIFEAWSTEACEVADRLDPMKRPLAEVLMNFQLKDDPLG